MDPTPLIAHAGHWAVQALMFAPVIAFIGWIAFVQLKERLGGDRDERPGEPPDDP